MESLTKIMECKRHGKTVYAQRSDGRYRCRQCSVDNVTEWRRRIKTRAVEYLGGCCKYCGYNKYFGSLEFHHPNNDKDFGLSQSGITRSWDRVRKELDKCELVCRNCHAEIHADVINNKSMEIKTTNRELLRIPREDNYCVDCGAKIGFGATRCLRCFSIFNRKIKNRPCKEQLIKEIKESSYVAVGRKYGVSDNTIRKWIK